MSSPENNYSSAALCGTPGSGRPPLSHPLASSQRLGARAGAAFRGLRLRWALPCPAAPRAPRRPRPLANFAAPPHLGQRRPRLRGRARHGAERPGAERSGPGRGAGRGRGRGRGRSAARGRSVPGRALPRWLRRPLPVFSLISQRTLKSAGFILWQLSACFLQESTESR